MNILVTNISKFSQRKTEYEYEIRFSDSSLKTVKAYQTNESILKAFSSINSIQKNGGINKIIMLVSNEVLETKNADYANQTACEYYLKLVKEYFPNADQKQIKIENDDKTPRENSSILDEICSEIKSSDVVYIDGAGGQRNIGNLIQLLTKILNYKGIQNPYTLDSVIQNRPAFICNTKDFQNMMKLADAFNEFMTTGKVNQLFSYYSKDMTNGKFNELLKVMRDFSDKIQLGDIETLDETIKKLDECIKECEKVEDSFNIGTVILKQFLPVIRKKLIGNEEKIDYVKIIEWCLENNLIQQALTVFVEKIPVYLFNSKIIKYSGDILKARQEFNSKKNPLASNWESFAFYSEILEPKENLAIELENWLKIEANPKSKNGINAVNILKRMEKEWNNLSRFEKDYKYLVDKKNQNNNKDFVTFKKGVENDRKIMYKLLGFESESNLETTEKKFKAVEKIKNGTLDCKPYIFNASSKKIAEIYYGYIYIKTLRNRVNHASSEENLTFEQKKILEEYEYDFEHFSSVHIKRNIKTALNAILEAENPLDSTNIMEEKVTEAESYSTDLNKGDIVCAYCTEPKIVRIEGYDYDIQLVIPTAHNAFEYVDKNLKVEIQQISKVQKICQVKFTAFLN